MARPARPMFPALDAALLDCAEGAMSVKDACKFTGVGRSEMYEAVARGELEALYHGRKPLIPKRVLVAWLARKLEAARAERAGAGVCTGRSRGNPHLPVV